jgi:type I restriction enzyme M protein
MNSTVHSSIVNFIWGIADDCLRDIYVRGKYRDVILPMTVIRRLDTILERQRCCAEHEGESRCSRHYQPGGSPLSGGGQPSITVRSFTLRDLKARAKLQQLKQT